MALWDTECWFLQRIPAFPAKGINSAFSQNSRDVEFNLLHLCSPCHVLLIINILNAFNILQYLSLSGVLFGWNVLPVQKCFFSPFKKPRGRNQEGFRAAFLQRNLQLFTPITTYWEKEISRCFEDSETQYPRDTETQEPKMSSWPLLEWGPTAAR